MAYFICRKWVTSSNGMRIYAKDYGLRAFCFWVDKILPKKEPEDDNSSDSTE